jgi:hypothetical protein
MNCSFTGGKTPTGVDEHAQKSVAAYIGCRPAIVGAVTRRGGIKSSSAAIEPVVAIEGGIPTVGYSISWIAFQGKGKDDVLSLMGLVDTGEADRTRRSPVSGAALPTGWYVLFFNEYSFITPGRLAKLSAGCVVVACEVEEHVGASASFLYKDGRHVWTVTHEPDAGSHDLSVDGDPPGVFPRVRDSVLREQDHAFEIPVQLAAELCGYWHDRWKVGYEPRFSRLESMKT